MPRSINHISEDFDSLDPDDFDWSKADAIGDERLRRLKKAAENQSASPDIKVRSPAPTA